MPIPEVFDVNNAENTMSYAPSRSSDASILRLQLRYPDIDFENCLLSICHYLRTHGTQDLLDKFRVAERALFPEFGAASHREGLKVASYFWMATVDDDPEVFSKVFGREPRGNEMEEYIAQRQENFVEALYQTQRFNNFITQLGNNGINVFVDNGAEVDMIVCSRGVRNKFNELFVNYHPDVILIQSVPELIADLLKGFVADYVVNKLPLSRRITIQQLVAADNEVVNLPLLLNSVARNNIKNSIISALGGRYSESLGLVKEQHESDIVRNLTDEYLEYLNFVKNEQRVPTVEGVQDLINDANNRLATALAAQVPRALFTPAFNYVHSIELLHSNLPRPTNRACAWWSATMTIDANLEVVHTDPVPLPSSFQVPTYQPLVWSSVFSSAATIAPAPVVPPPPKPISSNPTAAEIAQALQPSPHLTPVQAHVARDNRLRARRI